MWLLVSDDLSLVSENRRLGLLKNGHWASGAYEEIFSFVGVLVRIH